MGTGFTVDTPIRIAKYGISSVVSIGDDILIEKMRRHHTEAAGRDYKPIGQNEPDSRARRIRAYLDLLAELVAEQVDQLRLAPFATDPDINKYFELLPDGDLRQKYLNMTATDDADARTRLEDELRAAIVPGSIDVNIMTKLDRDLYIQGEKQPPESALAMSALRGYAESTLSSAIVLSAGLNRRLYQYMASFADFLPGDQGAPRKRIILKVSDVRSALFQSKLLAKLGLWVSEFRIESGLNCGGHAFATKGKLLGPILEEFRTRRDEMVDELFGLYTRGLAKAGAKPCATIPTIAITVQGGIGTHAEHKFLLDRYAVSSTGWGTPFLLVPEVTNVDDQHLELLAQAGEDDVSLSGNSPLGIPFWNLKHSSSEQTRLQRVAQGKPGSPCPQGFLVSDSEFTEIPICRASRQYQHLKLHQLPSLELPPDTHAAAVEEVQDRACICVDLAGGALKRHGIDPDALTAVCCGPNIANFDRVVSLKEMVDHIYGRLSLISRPDRPHMFIKELSLYIDQLRGEISKSALGLLQRTAAYFEEFVEGLREGTTYYRELAADLEPRVRDSFLAALDHLSAEIDLIHSQLGAPCLNPAPDLVIEPGT